MQVVLMKYAVPRKFGPTEFFNQLISIVKIISFFVLNNKDTTWELNLERNHKIFRKVIYPELV